LQGIDDRSELLGRGIDGSINRSTEALGALTLVPPLAPR
jgi:hypothetical protein